MRTKSNKQLAISARCGFCLLLIVYCLLPACSIPNLEPTPCIEARTPVREFYSFHFGNEMRFSPESLKEREKFLTAGFTQKLASWQSSGDPFTTGNDDLPKAFRVGSCKEIAPDKTEFQVLLFWRDDTRSEQREIKVTSVKQNDRWLVDGVNR